MTRLTEHFTLEELCVSQVAARKGLDNTPNAKQAANLLRVAQILETIRALVNRPLVVSSGFRSKAVNELVGGAANSAHTNGLAADIICPAFGSPLDLARAVAQAKLPYDQLIHEFGRWVHIGLSDSTPRRQALTICSAAAGYQQGVLKCGN